MLKDSDFKGLEILLVSLALCAFVQGPPDFVMGWVWMETSFSASDSKTEEKVERWKTHVFSDGIREKSYVFSDEVLGTYSWTACESKNSPSASPPPLCVSAAWR